MYALETFWGNSFMKYDDGIIQLVDIVTKLILSEIYLFLDV